MVNHNLSAILQTPLEIVSLDPWTRLGIIAGIALFFVIFILIVVCSLSPYCPLFNCCPFNQKFIKKDEREYLQSSYGTLDAKPTVKKKVLKPYGMDIQREVESSDWSDGNSTEHMDLSVTKLDKKDTKLLPTSDDELSFQEKSLKGGGHLCYKLRYEKDNSKLVIKVVKATDLPLIMHNQISADNYVRIRLYRTRRPFLNLGRNKPSKSFPLNTLDLELQTKIQRKTRSPIFNESFDIFVNQKHLKDYTMRLQLCDFDQLSCHTVQGDIVVSLRDLKKLDNEDEYFDQQLCEPIQDALGDMNICLTFLPTSEKLCLKVVRAINLPMMNKEKKSTDAYVRISLMCDGRQMKKAKTVVRESTLNPVFNESFIFDVPSEQLQNIYFILSVFHHHIGAEKTGYLMGRVYMGEYFDVGTKVHWQEMMKNSRKEIGAWYKIRG